MKWVVGAFSVVAISLVLSGCITPSRLRQVTAEPVHLVGVAVAGPDALASPDRRRLTDVEITLDGKEITPFVSYRAPGDEVPYHIDLAILKPQIRERYLRALRDELGERLATPQETASLPGIDSVTDRGSFESFVAAQSVGTYLYAQLEIEPDLSYPRVSGDFETENGSVIEIKASENIPTVIQIDLSSRLDLRTPERPSRNLIQYNFNLNYARTGTPEYPTEVLRRPAVALASNSPLLVAFDVRGGGYRVSAQQETVAEDLATAAARLGERAARPFANALPPE
jgi:hypothetical protein